MMASCSWLAPENCWNRSTNSPNECSSQFQQHCPARAIPLLLVFLPPQLIVLLGPVPQPSLILCPRAAQPHTGGSTRAPVCSIAPRLPG